MKKYDVIILGAGASGLMCAAHLSTKLSVGIIEGNEKIAQKLKISGGGKCNITNIEVDASHYDGDSSLIQNTLNGYSKEDLLNFLRFNGLKPVIRDGRYYFCPKSSDEIIDILKAKTRHVDFRLSHKILDVKKLDVGFVVKTDRGEFVALKVVVATGGKSYESIGASDIGLKIAKSFGLDVREFEPALVGMTLQPQQFWMKELSGISCDVAIKIADKRVRESLLFAHRGISGLAVLSASLYWRKGKISVDFLPDQNIFEIIKTTKKLLSSALPLPKRLSLGLLNACEIKDMPCNMLNPHAKEKLQLLHNYEFAPAGNFGFTKAEASRGGVVACGIDGNFEAHAVKGLFFIGEVVDVTGELGGYNFQWAFSSAVVCASAISVCDI